MKKILFAAAAALTALAGCKKNEIAVLSAEDAVLYATIEENAASRTYMDASNNIRWSEGDQIAAFIKVSYGVRYQVNPSFVGKTYAEFSIVPSDKVNDDYGVPEWDHNVAYYPYSDDVKASGAMDAVRSESSYTLNVVLPSEQTYVPDSFGEGAMAMVAVSEDKNFTFRNVLGGMKLQLKGTQTVTSISLEGKNGEKLSGAASLKAYAGATKPKISMSDAASGAVTLNCGSGVQLNESTTTVFIIALPPVTFSQGFTVTVTDSDGKTYTVETDKLNEVIRSSLLVMPPVTLGASDEEEPEISGVDYIDEYGVNHGKGIEIDGVVWAPVNCGYHETDFKYGKLYQWGRKYGQGYTSNYDASVPETLNGQMTPDLGHSEIYKNVFFLNNTYDWVTLQNDHSWNLGNESSPVKTESDPCPEGWRVPTYEEINILNDNYSSFINKDGQNGRYFCGKSLYTETTPKVFLPAAGLRYQDGTARGRGDDCYYWSSTHFSNTIWILYSNPGNVRKENDARSRAYSVRCVQDDNELIPVSSLTLSETSICLDGETTYDLSTTISPSDANHQTALWWSDDTSVARVNQEGQITAVSAGTTIINAMAGMQVATCEVVVKLKSDGDYVDEYGVNHGKGIRIGETVWAPVNCGYHATDFKYGKMYQWGRKYGQGYSGKLYGIDNRQIGEYSDAVLPKFVESKVADYFGNHPSNSNIFYVGAPNWADSYNDQLWNSGSESQPTKAEYDPCPDGWRVPTYTELSRLIKNYSSWTTENDQNGYWFSGESLYSSEVPQIFLQAGGNCDFNGTTYSRGRYSIYWSSTPNSESSSSTCYVAAFASYEVKMGSDLRANGFSVRCVQVTD